MVSTKEANQVSEPLLLALMYDVNIKNVHVCLSVFVWISGVTGG